MARTGDIYCMIIPTDIRPIDYLKGSNEYIFVTAGFILRVNYVDRHFELETPNKLAYYENFDLLKSPPEWLETIDFGIVDWIRAAINWNSEQPLPENNTVPFSFKVEGVVYSGTFNPRTNNLSLWIPGKTIICKRDAITTEFPEIQFMDRGELISKVTDIIINKIKAGQPSENADYPPALPLVFRTTSFVAGYRMYDFDYNVELDLALLIIPEREVQANLLTIETDALELAELHQGMLFDMIRSVVYEKSPSE